MATSRGSRGCSQIASAPGATDRAALMCGDRGSEDVSREMCSILDRSRRQFEYTLLTHCVDRLHQPQRFAGVGDVARREQRLADFDNHGFQ